jgi:arylsulfatase
MASTPPSRGYEDFTGTIGRTMGQSRPAWRPERRARDGAPNIVVVLLDDLGFSDFSPYGGEIDTPNVARVADGGRLLTSYHTTPLCSPSRAALLTGINPHRAGFAFPANLDPGFPSYAFELPDDAPTLAESLRAGGYATFAVGKWHLTREGAAGDAADKSSWPLQRGFDRYFGSLEGFTSLHAPHRLIWDNSPYDVDDYPDDYFLTDDLTDRAIGMVRSLRAHDATKPFFLYVAHHAVHGPIQAKPADLAKYRGRYAQGWDRIREQRFARQRAAGLFADDVVLPPSNHEPGKDVGPWDELTADQQERFARYMEVYAASVDNVDQNLGRLLDVIEQYGELDNTIVVVTSDNGATSEGGPVGTRSYFSQFALLPELPPDWDRDVERDLDLVGGPRTTVHYPRGWGQASNTPFRLYKLDTLGGGVRAPFVIRWPRGLPTAPDDSGVRDQFVNVTDVAGTLLELAGVPRLTERAGLVAAGLDGLSAVPVLRDSDVAPVRREQYGEMGGNRYFISDRWKIVTVHRPDADYGDHEWQLYDLEDDPTETTDLAELRPEVVTDLSRRWEEAAWWNTVFPLVDTTPARDLYRPGDSALSEPVTLYPGTGTLERYRSARLVQLRDVEVRIRLEHTAGDRGVLVAHGDQGGGYLLAVEDGAVRLSYNAYGDLLRSEPLALPVGQLDVVLTATVLPEFRWQLELSVEALTSQDGEVDEHVTRTRLGPVPQLLAMAPFTGISIGRDAGGAVDWDLHVLEGQFPFTGRLHWVRYLPGRPADYDPREVARIWAAAALALD